MIGAYKFLVGTPESKRFLRWEWSVVLKLVVIGWGGKDVDWINLF
jgi:hypothetical protein